VKQGGLRFIPKEDENGLLQAVSARSMYAICRVPNEVDMKGIKSGVRWSRGGTRRKVAWHAETDAPANDEAEASG
jgi:hypothetical protein